MGNHTSAAIRIRTAPAISKSAPVEILRKASANERVSLHDHQRSLASPEPAQAAAIAAD